MSQLTVPAKAYQQYTAAHEAHYKAQDLAEALSRYRRVMAAHPDTVEAKFSRVQIGTIVNSVVPKQALFDAQVDLALEYIEHLASPSVEPDQVAADVYDPVDQQE